MNRKRVNDPQRLLHSSTREWWFQDAQPYVYEPDVEV